MSDRTILIFIGGILLFIIISISQLKNDIARTQRTLNKIAKQVKVPDEMNTELKKLILKGKEVEAVKKYRFDTGADLIEAKKYIDSISERD